jgi:hypothetical protein
MPDITMCPGVDCIIKNKCYRYTAPPSEYRQSFFTSSPLQIIDENNQKCDHYWDNTDRRSNPNLE